MKQKMTRVTLGAAAYMGLGHLLLGRFKQGAAFAAAEAAFLLALPWLGQRLSGLATLGNTADNLGNWQGTHSIFLLIDGVLALVLIGCFLTLYVFSVRSARRAARWPTRAPATVRDKGFPFFALAPSLALLLLFVVTPLAFSFLAAFTNYSAPSHIPPKNLVQWVGLDNFRTLFGGNATWAGALGRVVGWTLVWAASATVTCYAGGMVLAVLLTDRRIRFPRFFRSIFILPYAVPGVVTALVWKNLLNGAFGTVNKTLLLLGWITAPIPWLSDPLMAKFTLVLVNLWTGFPYFMLLITGAMTSISPQVYEAGAMDGCSRLQSFRHITLPSVLYQTLPLLLMSFTHNINNFGAVFFLTGGNPAVADTTVTTAYGTDIVVTWIYKLTITLQRYDMASVLAVLVFAALAPFAVVNFMRSKSFREGEL